MVCPPISLAIIDIDYFKAYNDLYGHPAGDESIRLVGELMRRAFDRPTDYAARYGGEEFVCILPDTELNGGQHVVERFRKTVEEAAIPLTQTPAQPPVSPSVSASPASSRRTASRRKA